MPRHVCGCSAGHQRRAAAGTQALRCVQRQLVHLVIVERGVKRHDRRARGPADQIVFSVRTRQSVPARDPRIELTMRNKHPAGVEKLSGGKARLSFAKSFCFKVAVA